MSVRFKPDIQRRRRKGRKRRRGVLVTSVNWGWGS